MSWADWIMSSIVGISVVLFLIYTLPNGLISLYFVLCREVPIKWWEKTIMILNIIGLVLSLVWYFGNFR